MATDDSQNFADHQSIERVLNLYAYSLDQKKWSDLENVFVEDAVANFIGIGVCEGRQAITDLISGVLSKCSVTQHLLGNVDIEINGDQATTNCYLTALHVGIDDYATKTLTIWGQYTDEFIRTADGWRIKHRTLTTMHGEGDIGLAG